AGSFSHPSLTANGRFVAFASTANLTGQNADGNWEIFRVDRQTLATVQVTNTLPPCENRSPSIGNDTAGNVIAFTTTCSLPGFPNPQGNMEVVAWNGTSFAGTNTSGCQSFAPVVARAQPRFVAFVSTCNLSGNNADGNPEIFRWNRQTGVFQQITNTVDPVAQDSPSIERTGNIILFISNGNFTGGNADGSYELFRWQSPATISQVSNDSPTAAYVSGKLDEAGVWAVGERLDLNSFQFETRLFYTLSGGAGSSLFSASDPLLPSLSAGGGVRRIALQSAANVGGGNSDGNVEIYQIGTAGGIRRLLCSQPNAAIPDNNANGVSNTITSPVAGTVADMDVWVQIAHPRVSDVHVQLTSPAGTAVVLVDRPGIPGAGCNGDNVDAVLDDERTQPAETQCLNLPALSGYLVPNNPLSNFDGQATNGNWILRVSDRQNGETGTFQRWCLAFQLN
ncbi:MAG: proprotein convertase P-domain-containing protein, partial [Thermoanaerobaculum sp.]